MLKGIDSRCAACGGPRSMLAAPSLTLAGTPSRWGGRFAVLLGVMVLVLGLSSALGLLLLLQSIWPATWVGWAFAIPVGSASLLFGSLLLWGGKSLARSGSQRRLEVQKNAVRAIVERERGPITAEHIGQRLELPAAEVDALLTELARERATAVTIDVDAEGRLVYDFEGEDRRFRVLEAEAERAEAEETPDPAGRAARRGHR